MADKLPQPTGVLISRLQRVARKLGTYADGRRDGIRPSDSVEVFRAQSNTCWQAAARLEQLLQERGSK